MNMVAGTPEHGREVDNAAKSDSAPPRPFGLDEQCTTHIEATNNQTLLPLPNEIRAMTAAFNTAELLEHILSYLSPLQLLRSKATCRNFRNAIDASPSLRKTMNIFIRLSTVNEEDLFKTDAGGDVIYPIKGLDPLAFFYPSDAEKRLFIRFSTDRDIFEKVRRSSGFGNLIIVDQPLLDATIGWHCSCFAESSFEARLSCGEGGTVTFGDVLGSMDAENKQLGLQPCGNVIKFWLDGLWKRSDETRELGH